MHMFSEANPVCLNKVKYDVFRELFNKNFNYSFGRPQIDICSTCEGFSKKMKDQNLSDNAKQNVTADQMLYKKHAKKFFSALKVAQENEDDDTVALAFGFLLCLKGTQLTCIYIMRDKQVTHQTKYVLFCSNMFKLYKVL